MFSCSVLGGVCIRPKDTFCMSSSILFCLQVLLSFLDCNKGLSPLECSHAFLAIMDKLSSSDRLLFVFAILGASFSITDTHEFPLLVVIISEYSCHAAVQNLLSFSGSIFPLSLLVLSVFICLPVVLSSVLA